MGHCGTLEGFLKNRGLRGPDNNTLRNKTGLHKKSSDIISFLSHKDQLSMTIKINKMFIAVLQKARFYNG